MKVLVIGGVAAGMSAASKVKRELKEGVEVIVFDKGEELSYGACGLPYYIGGINDKRELLIIRTKEQFEKSGIQVRTYSLVQKVDPVKKQIEVLDLINKEIYSEDYDKLVIATGALPVNPWETPEKKNVYTLKGLADADRIKKAALNAGHICIIGGGYIGVEMVEAFLHMGKAVTLLEGADRILPNFDSEISEIALKHLESKGVRVVTGCMISSVEDDGGKTTVYADSGSKSYESDMTVVSIGVRPATAFMKNTGVKMLANGAIVVDELMRSSLPDVYAGGDCATVYHKILKEDVYLPLGTNANKAGKLIGENLAGKQNTFYGALGTAMIKIVDLEAAMTGVSQKQAEQKGFNYDKVFVTAKNHAPYYPDPQEIHIKLIYDKDTRIILGGQLIGGKGTALRINVLAACIDQKMKISDIGQLDLGYAPPFSTVWDALSIAASVADK